MGLGFVFWVYVGLSMSPVGMNPPVLQVAMTQAACERQRAEYLAAGEAENAGQAPAFRQTYGASQCQMVAGRAPKDT